VITFVTFKWRPSPNPIYRSTFGPEQVIVLRNMIARHYQRPHRFVCVTDDAAGLKGIETLPLWNDFAAVPNPNGSHNPSCYRRLKLFHPDAGKVFGEWLVAVDLDLVITGDLAPLLAGDEDFKIWGQSDYPKTQWYNGSIWKLKTGSRPRVWTEFDPRTSPRLALKAGKKGSDQGWFSYILGPNEATWGTQDGIYSYRVHLAKRQYTLPEDARVVVFHGKHDPWSYHCQHHGWIREHYR
jgi:hypothetical protein